MNKLNWNYPTNMWVGENRIKDITKACKNLNISKPLLVTDQELSKKNVVKNTLSILKNDNFNVVLYSNVFGNKYTIVRPSALYGERCISNRVIQIFLENFLV